MAESIFKTGDLVQLRSGGPHMTVTGITKRQVKCSWFDDDKKERQSKFPQTALQHEGVDDLTDEELKLRTQAR